MPIQHVSSTQYNFLPITGFGTPTIAEVAYLPTAGVDPTDPDYDPALIVDDQHALWDMALGAFFGTPTFGLGQTVPDYFVGILVSGEVDPFMANTPALEANDYSIWYRLTIGVARPVFRALDTLTVFQEGP